MIWTSSTKSFRRATGPSCNQNTIRSWGKGKKHSFEDRVHLRRVSERSRDKENEWIPEQQKDKRRKDGQCVRCGMSNHKIEACPNQWRNTPLFRKTTTFTQPVTKKARIDQGHFCITDVTGWARECSWRLSYTGADVGRHWYRSSKGYDGQRHERAGVTCVAGDGRRRQGREQLSKSRVERSTRVIARGQGLIWTRTRGT